MKKQILTFLEKLKDNCFTDIGQADSLPTSSRIGNSSWIKLPNVRKFKVFIKDHNSLYAYLGLRKRNRPDFEWAPYRNAKYNVYMARQLRRLEGFRDRPVIYFQIAFFLMCRSKVFRVAAINKVFPNWYKEIPLSLVMKVNRKCSTLLNTLNSDLIMKRVYIEKGGGKFRPLGVPTLEWRLVLYMWNCFLFDYLSPHMDPSQHGFIPGKGTKTAWTEIFQKVVKSKYIYEYDLENYFNNLNLAYITDYLITIGVPKWVAYYLENINRCTPELTENDKCDESQYRHSKQDQEDIRKGYFRWESPMYDPIRDYLRTHSEPQLWNKIEESGSESIFEYVQFLWAMSDSVNPTQTSTQFKGVAQGTNTGPTLSLIPLLNFNTYINSIKYANDGILYGDQEFSIRSDIEAGAIINTSKSRWVNTMVNDSVL